MIENKAVMWPRLRVGRRNPRNLYLQRGPEPRDDDPCVGFMIDDDTGALIADALNSPWHLNEIRLSVEDRDAGPPTVREPARVSTPQMRPTCTSG